MGDRDTQVKARVLAIEYAGTEHAHDRVFDDWTHYFRQEDDQILVDSNHPHGGPACFRLEMLNEEAAADAYQRISEADEDEEVDIRDLQPKYIPIE